MWLRSYNRRLFASQPLNRLQTPIYRLIDSGDQRKLEQFGEIIVDRPCLVANWKKSRSSSIWKQQNVVYYDSDTLGNQNSDNGWIIPIKLKNLFQDQDWIVRFGSNSFSFDLSLNLFEQGQVGVFPEQQENWNWISNTLDWMSKSNRNSKFRVLNAFAFTGGSSLAALSVPGVEVIHLDASRSSVRWAQNNYSFFLQNLQSFSSDSSLPTSSHRTMRFMVDDCLSFLKREIRRMERKKKKEEKEEEQEIEEEIGGNSNVNMNRMDQNEKEGDREGEGRQAEGGEGEGEGEGGERDVRPYSGLIFDPPAFGRYREKGKGKGKGKEWEIERDLPVLLSVLPSLLPTDEECFIVLSCHDSRYPPSILTSLLLSALSSPSPSPSLSLSSSPCPSVSAHVSTVTSPLFPSLPSSLSSLLKKQIQSYIPSPSSFSSSSVSPPPSLHHCFSWEWTEKNPTTKMNNNNNNNSQRQWMCEVEWGEMTIHPDTHQEPSPSSSSLSSPSSSLPMGSFVRWRKIERNKNILINK